MTNQLKNLANLITDIRIVGGVIITIVGVVVWVAISWTSLLNRVGAIEEVESDRVEINQSISNKLNELKVQQAVLGEQINGVDQKLTETNNIVRELLKFFK